MEPVLNSPEISFDIAIIGGGIVGLAIAYQLMQRYPERSVVLLEKESELAHHQTGRNSGVLHSGIYYKPGTLRAKNCRAGKIAMQEFCAEYAIPFEICGKVIVATQQDELPRLQTIFERGQANGVQCELIGTDRLLELEPHCAGIAAIHVPEAGIVDYRAVCRKLAQIVSTANTKIVLSARVTNIQNATDRVELTTTAGDFSARSLVTCAGLQSDRVATLAGAKPDAQIVPFRGEYFLVKPSAEHLCKNLIYPVPDPRFPFLGVHFTRMVNGGVECGPNAVLAFAREGYRKRDINLRDLWETIAYPGFRKLAKKYWRMGAQEMWRSFSKQAFVRSLQRLIPEITSKDIEHAPAGVRAQAVAPDGELVDDFLVVESERAIHVCNAPSPAATASLNVGSLIIDRLAMSWES